MEAMFAPWYVGKAVRKFFPGHGFFNGTVASFRKDDYDGEVLFHIVYEDEDEEDLSFDEVQEAFIAAAQESRRPRRQEWNPRPQKKARREHQAAPKIDTHVPSLPVFSSSTLTLNEDIMEEIVMYLDPASYCTLTAVSRTYHEALIPRQKKVWVGGFKTFKDFQRYNFIGMEFFSARNCAVVDNIDLKHLAMDRKKRYPALSGIDLTDSSHKDLNSAGIKHIMDQGLGRRLKELIVGDRNGGKAMTDCQIKTIARAPCLEKLSLCVGSRKGGATMQNSLLAFEDHSALRDLCIIYDASFHRKFRQLVLLPESLPHLEKLTIDCRCEFPWRMFQRVRYPNLRELHIYEYVRGADATLHSLCADYLIDVLKQAPHFRKLAIKSVSVNCKLYRGESSEEEERLFGYLEARRIEYYGPEHLTAKCGADFGSGFQRGRDGHAQEMFINKGKWIHKKWD